MIQLLDLFSGIGGFSLGLERTGAFKTVAFCEIDHYCQQVLKKHWPKVPCYDDIRTLSAERLATDGIAVDAICGGFPCQDISVAGKQVGLEGKCSGLWREYGRLIGELRPSFVFVENVPNLLNLGMGVVLGDLAALGYDAVWDCIPASAVGAPHQRDRVWIIAHTSDGGQRELFQSICKPWGGVEANSGCNGETQPLADAYCERSQGWHGQELPERSREWTARTSSPLAYPSRSEREGYWSITDWESRGSTDESWWGSEPNVCRVADGIPSRVDRIKGLGNAVVPQLPELLGNAVKAAFLGAAQ